MSVSIGSLNFLGCIQSISTPVDKVFELCLAEIEKRAPANSGEVPTTGKCIIM